MHAHGNSIQQVHKPSRRGPAISSNTMASRLTWCSLLVWLTLATIVRAENHCSEHRYEHSLNTHHLQFTKEIPDREYGVLRQFKSLHCCGKGYRSIEWFKNNKPHPWSKDVSSFIVYPEAANQTIYSPRLEENDIGNYTCILRNETHAIKHEIELRLQDNKPDNPMPTFRPKDMMVSVGESARFYCEAYVGNLYLPDAANEIVWSQMFDDDPHNVTDSVQVNVTREAGQIIGSYLSIPNIKAHHYGRYRCQIMSGNSAQKLNLSVLLSPVEVTTITDSQLSALVYIMATLLFVLVVLFAWICRTVQQRTSGKKDNRCSAQFIAEHESV